MFMPQSSTSYKTFHPSLIFPFHLFPPVHPTGFSSCIYLRKLVCYFCLVVTE